MLLKLLVRISTTFGTLSSIEAPSALPYHAPKIIKGVEMTPDEIKQLTPDGYGGDFELTMEAGQ